MAIFTKIILFIITTLVIVFYKLQRAHVKILDDFTHLTRRNPILDSVFKSAGTFFSQPCLVNKLKLTYIRSIFAVVASVTCQQMMYTVRMRRTPVTHVQRSRGLTKRYLLLNCTSYVYVYITNIYMPFFISQFGFNLYFT